MINALLWRYLGIRIVVELETPEPINHEAIVSVFVRDDATGEIRERYISA